MSLAQKWSWQCCIENVAIKYVSRGSKIRPGYTVMLPSHDSSLSVGIDIRVQVLAYCI